MVEIQKHKQMSSIILRPLKIIMEAEMIIGVLRQHHIYRHPKNNYHTINN